MIESPIERYARDFGYYLGANFTLIVLAVIVLTNIALVALVVWAYRRNRAARHPMR